MKCVWPSWFPDSRESLCHSSLLCRRSARIYTQGFHQALKGYGGVQNHFRVRFGILPDFRVEILNCTFVWLGGYREADGYEHSIESLDSLTIDQHAQLIFTLEGEVHDVAGNINLIKWKSRLSLPVGDESCIQLSSLSAGRPNCSLQFDLGIIKYDHHIQSACE